MFKMPMDRRTCLMGIDVHSGSRVVALIGLAFCLLFAVPLVFSHVLYSRAQFDGFDGFNGAMASGLSICVFLVTVIVNAGLLVGNLTRQSILYLPFIFVNVAAALVVSLILLLAAVFGGIGLFYPDSSTNSTADLLSRLDATSSERVQSGSSELLNFALMSVMLTAFVVLMSVGLAIHSYVISVVWRGYRFLCKYEDLDEESESSEVKETAESTVEIQIDERF